MDAALRHDVRRLRLRHHIRSVIRAWGRAEARCPPSGRGAAAEGRAEALALLAHWSGRADDRRAADVAQVRAKRIREMNRVNGVNLVARRDASKPGNVSSEPAGGSVELPPGLAQIRAEMRAAHADIVALLERRDGARTVSSRGTIRRVVIDPGHGGRDVGASSPDRLREKDVNLDVARRLASELERRFKIEATLTRNSDRFVSLTDRVRIAHHTRAELLVSIHANAHSSEHVHGIETYYPGIGADSALSEHVARSVQRAMMITLRKHYEGVRDLGVKRGPFHVLVAPRMPAVLVEIGFVTHAMERRRLASSAYQARVAAAIAEGIGEVLQNPPQLARWWTPEGGSKGGPEVAQAYP